MRRLAVLLCALVVGLGFSVSNLVIHATPAHADTAFWCGNGAEVVDSVYEDTSLRRVNSTLVLDSYPYGPSYHYVDTDLKTYHVNYSNLCWRAYYQSNWTEDGTGMWSYAWIRAWVCGGGPYQWNSGQQAVPNVRVVTTGSWGPSAWIIRNVQMWDGTIQQLTFAPYGNAQDSTLCGPQADNYGARATSPTWSPQYIYADPANPYWYVHGW